MVPYCWARLRAASARGIVVFLEVHFLKKINYVYLWDRGQPVGVTADSITKCTIHYCVVSLGHESLYTLNRLLTR